MLESRWIAEQLEFYEGDHTTFIIPKYGNPFEFGEAGGGYDVKMWGASTGTYLLWDKGGNRLNLYGAGLNIYGSSGVEAMSFSSSDALVDFNGINITYNDPKITYSTGTGSSGTGGFLTTKSARWQFLGPTTGTGDLMVKLPATSESQGIEFLIWNVWSTGGGQALTDGQNLLVTTTGMGATTGTIIRTIVKNNYAKFYADGQTWRSILGSSA
jgi:hypothetical protein